MISANLRKQICFVVFPSETSVDIQNSIEICFVDSAKWFWKIDFLFEPVRLHCHFYLKSRKERYNIIRMNKLIAKWKILNTHEEITEPSIVHTNQEGFCSDLTK